MLEIYIWSFSRDKLGAFQGKIFLKITAQTRKLTVTATKKRPAIAYIQKKGPKFFFYIKPHGCMLPKCINQWVKLLAVNISVM